jgi:hypothetical protein
LNILDHATLHRDTDDLGHSRVFPGGAFGETAHDCCCWL